MWSAVVIYICKCYGKIPSSAAVPRLGGQIHFAPYATTDGSLIRLFRLSSLPLTPSLSLSLARFYRASRITLK